MIIKSKGIQWNRYVVGMGEVRYQYTVLIRKSLSKRSFGKPRNRSENNKKQELKVF
jgi:hypothetical protein